MTILKITEMVKPKSILTVIFFSYRMKVIALLVVFSVIALTLAASHDDSQVRFGLVKYINLIRS
jgi:hypothetical protein